MEEQGSVWERFKRFLHECLRVLKVTKRPDKQEFLTTFKVAGLGMLIIGLLGFVIQLIKLFFFKV
ncbi:protein translocase SEC61 complex subunit gamma [Candidatus Woesearchaeota archaeon]|nr:protein translocase SEC61 complex subunit gamma [Candidatus Woesearchaeota archaeon]